MHAIAYEIFFEASHLSLSLPLAFNGEHQSINGPDYWIPEYNNYLQQIYEAFPKSYVAVHFLLSMCPSLLSLSLSY